MGDEQTRDETGAVAPARILVIDDEEVIHRSLERLLGKQGHEVVSVLTAREGLEQLQGKGFDMVITDLMMPEMNGLELLEKLQQLEIDLPVLMITGYPTIKTAMQAMRLGAVDYLAKPFRRNELLAPVNRMLRRRAGREAAAAAEAAAKAAGERPAPPRPGACLVLRDHAWAQVQQDGTVRIGIERSFLESTGRLASLALPGEAELVEQGYVGLRLVTDAGEEHGVFMPLSGQVVALNEQAAAAPDRLDAETWLVQIIPSHFDSEQEYLQHC